MPMDLRLKRLKMFLDFWYSPWGAAKSARWAEFCGLTYHVDSAIEICRAIILNYPLVCRLKWSVLEGLQDAA